MPRHAHYFILNDAHKPVKMTQDVWVIRKAACYKEILVQLGCKQMPQFK